MFSFLAGIAGNVALGWVGRRALEVGGWLTTVVSSILLLPPEHRDVVIEVLSGQGGGVSIAAYLGLATYIASQVMSYRSTVKEHAVVGGRRVPVQTPAEALAANNRATGNNQTTIPRR